jgi:branched-chain amino acid transport system substrate-binding protein
MRMEPGTYIAAAARSAVIAIALAAAGCGGGHAKKERAPDGPLSVYVSVPGHGVEASTGAAVVAGARLALADAKGRAGDRDVRLIQLDDSKLQGPTWDPSAVETNAKRAAADPTTIAYVGELDEGGSAISVPVTNDAGIVQVSPLDGLTTLTRNQPGTATGTGPDRYYPSGTRTFMRLVPNDWLQAKALVGWAREQGATRLAIVQDDQVFGRSLAQQAAVAAQREKLPVTDIAEPHDDPATYPDFALKLAAERPDAVLYTGLGDATSGRLLAAIQRALPGARLFGSSALASAVPAPPGLPETQVLSPLMPPREYGPGARRLLARITPIPPAAAAAAPLYGYEAMRVVLDAIAASGADAGDRAAVARGALAARGRVSALGAYRVLPTGEVSTARFGAYRQSAAGVRYLGERVATR